MGAAEVNRGNTHILVIRRVGRNRTADFARDPTDAVDQGGGPAVTGRVDRLGSGAIVKGPITGRRLGMHRVRIRSSEQQGNQQYECQ